MFKGKRVHSELIDISLHGTLFKFDKHPKLNAFVSVGNDHDLSVWDLESLKLLYKKEGNEYAIADALIHDDYHIIASVNGTLKIYKGDEEPKVTQLPEIPLSICVHKNQLYVGTTSDKLLIYDLDTAELKCTQNQQPWVTQLRSHDDTLYIMGNQISYNENIVDIGHKGQIMHHFILGNKILTGDSSGKAILSSFPEFTKLYEYQMESAVVQLAIIENQDQLSLIIGTLDPGIVTAYVINYNKFIIFLYHYKYQRQFDSLQIYQEYKSTISLQMEKLQRLRIELLHLQFVLKIEQLADRTSQQDKHIVMFMND